MNLKKEKFYLFPNCQLVKGYVRSMIYDLHRRDYFPIPNSLATILTKYKNKTITEVKQHYQSQYHNIIDEYYRFLQKNELVLEVDDNDYSFFPKLDLTWESPFHITNGIIEYRNLDDLQAVLKQLKGLGVSNTQIHINEIEDIDIIIEVLNLNPDIETELFIKFNHAIEIEKFRKSRNISFLCIHSAPEDASISLPNILKAISVQQEMPFNTGCGNISPYYFTINYQLFFESQAHNTCLNRKLCIDAEGNIKNCPAMQQSFGNIKDISLQKAIEKPGFKDLWFIHKGQIEVCKDCEFRHMCTDCRCFIKDPANIYSQPSKCGYNPYIGKWKDEEGYVPVEECGTYNTKEGFVPDKRKIAVLNKQIWE